MKFLLVRKCQLNVWSSCGDPVELKNAKSLLGDIKYHPVVSVNVNVSTVKLKLLRKQTVQFCIPTKLKGNVVEIQFIMEMSLIKT